MDRAEYEAIVASDQRELEEQLDLIKKKATDIKELMDSQKVYKNTNKQKDIVQAMNDINSEIKNLQNTIQEV